MTITNAETGTSVHEIAAGVYRVSTPVRTIPGGFTFNQFLVLDEDPLLFHTGPRKMFPLVRDAVAHVLGDVAKLRYVAISHVEADECGSLDEWLTAAPRAEAVGSRMAAVTWLNDQARRPPRPLADGQELVLGQKTLAWLDAPHLPHNWECGYMIDKTSRTLLCGDLFTHVGAELPASTEHDVLGPAEATRRRMGYFAVDRGARAILEKLALTAPTTLALMHGSSFCGDGRSQLLGLADALGV